MSKLFLVLFCAAVAGWSQSVMPITGKEVAELKPFEDALRRIMTKWSIPGATLAMTENGRLIYARGFGFADREAGIPVHPTSRFRLASISKTITGMTILRLAQDGRLNLDAKFVDLIPKLTPATSPAPDPRMRNVTVRQLLQHTAGFDRPINDDHVNYYQTASRMFGNAPLTKDLQTRYIISQRLDFEPGARYVYGNSAYQLLGRVIEAVTGQSYLEAVKALILTPAGTRNFDVAKALLSQRNVDEVKYYDYPNAPLSPALVVPGAVSPLARQYNWWVEMGDSYGGLLGNGIEVLKYQNALEGRRAGTTPLLTAASLAAMAARPVPAVWPAASTNWTGLTWRFTATAGGQNWWHSGGAPGTRNLLMRRQDGRNWVVLMNSRPLDEDTILDEIFADFFTAQGQVRSWPTHDLYADFEGPALAASTDALSFNAGSAVAAPQTVQITATPTSIPVNFSVAAPVTGPIAAWLRFDRTSGAAPGALSVSVEPAGLAPGDYSTLFTITSPSAGNQPRYVRVSLRVTAAARLTGLRNTASQLAGPAAPGSRLTLQAPDLAAAPLSAEGVPAEGPLGGVTVRFTGPAGQPELTAAIAAVSPNAVDVIVPAGAEAWLVDGKAQASITVVTHKGQILRDAVALESASPALFSASRDGVGAILGTFTRTAADGTVTTAPAFQCAEGTCTAVAIDLGAETDQVVLQLAATGVRQITDPVALAVRIGEELAEVAAVEPSTTAGGVELITVRLPRTLIGRGELDVTLNAGGKTSNALKVVIAAAAAPPE